MAKLRVILTPDEAETLVQFALLPALEMVYADPEINGIELDFPIDLPKPEDHR